MADNGVQVEAWGGFAEGKNDLFTNPTLARDRRRLRQVGGAGRQLRWLIQRDVVIIPKSVRRERMAQNLDVFDFALTDDEMQRISTLDTGTSQFFDHRDPAMVSWLNSHRDR